MPVQLAVDMRASSHMLDTIAPQYVLVIVYAWPLLVASPPPLDAISDWLSKFQINYHSRRQLRFRLQELPHIIG